jgi:hypothetical protein
LAGDAAVRQRSVAMKTLARQRDKAELVARLRRLRPDSVRRWGRMSVHQMICHLCDGFRMGTGEKPVRSVAGPLRRTMVKWFALYVPMPWPPGIRTRPEIDQKLLGTRPVDFAADVAKLEALLELVTAQPRNFEWQSHPIFGSMSEADWLRWGYLHVDHHLRQFGA